MEDVIRVMEQTKVELTHNPMEISSQEAISDVTTEISEQIVVEKALCLSDMISDEVESNMEVPAEFKACSEQGLFSPAVGMARIVNRFNGSFYAKTVVNDNGCREIHYIQKYDNGTYSPEYVIKQEELLTVIAGSKSTDIKDKRDAEKIRKKLLKDYLSKCDGQMETSIFGQLIQVLYEILHQLPVEGKKSVMSTAQLYAEVIDVLRRRYSFALEDSRLNGYIAISICEIEGIAYELEMTSKRLLELLKKNRLLHLTDSCRGYESKVPVGRDKKTGKLRYEWCYCLYDLEYFAQKQKKDQKN